MSIEDKTFGLFDSSLNRKLIDKLENDGSFVYKFPNIVVNEIEITQIEMEVIINLQKFDWAIFTDVFSVDVFINRLEELEIDIFELDNLRVCAFGEAVADRLRFVQLHADVIANNFVDEDIFKQLEDYLFDVGEFDDLNILLVKERDTDHKIKEILENVGARVLQLDVYVSVLKENTTKLKALTKNGAIDEIIFNSADEVFGLSNMFYPETLFDSLDGITVLANNEIAFQTLREFGFNPHLRN